MIQDMDEVPSRARWYVMQVMSGQENRVLKSIEYRCEQNQAKGIDHGILEVIIPTKKVEERRNGKKIISERKLFPGYVLLHAEIYDEQEQLKPETWGFIKETQGVIGLIGGDRPVPLTEQEVQDMIPKEGEESELTAPERPALPSVGSRVKVISGPFEGFEGLVESADEVRLRLTVSVSIFGRSTPVEVESWQVEIPDE
jgi:transcriptional antiterminator NusG